MFCNDSENGISTSTYIQESVSVPEHDKVYCMSKVNLNTIELQSFFYNLVRPRSAVGNVSGYICVRVSDCRSRGHEFDPGPVSYFLRLFFSLLLNHSRRIVVSYKQKYVHEVLNS